MAIFVNPTLAAAQANSLKTLSIVYHGVMHIVWTVKGFVGFGLSSSVSGVYQGLICRHGLLCVALEELGNRHSGVTGSHLAGGLTF